jgi:DNA-binding transcriptional ArsR family regulator
MPLKNPLGDLEITDPSAMRALAHPVRLAILTHLQRHGPMTATGLSPHVGATPSVVSWHLRHLAGFGLVVEAPSPDRRQRFWKAVSRGFRYHMPDDDAGRSAARLLRTAMHEANLRQVADWTSKHEPRLAPTWDRLAGAANTRVVVTPEEVESVLAGIEQLLAPFVLRDDADTPEGARTVRFLRYTMPEAAPGSADV